MPMSMYVFKQVQARAERSYWPDPAELRPAYRRAWADALAHLSAPGTHPECVEAPDVQKNRHLTCKMHILSEQACRDRPA